MPITRNADGSRAEWVTADPKPYRPANGKPVKVGGKLIGYVSSKPHGPLGYFSVYRIKDDGSADNFGGAPSQSGAMRMVRDDYEDRTQPVRPWQVRTRNGSTIIVQATTERMAWRAADAALKRWARKALEPVNARVADPEFDDFKPSLLATTFGELPKDNS